MTRVLPEVQENKWVRWFANVLIGLLPVTVIVAVVMMALGRTSNELLVLVGVLVTQAVVLVGVLLRDSADYRTLALAAADSARIDRREKEAKKRLVMETTLRGVELISVDEPVTRNSAALLAMDALDQKRLAVALLQSLWPQGQVDAESATQVISSALSSRHDERLQRSAAAILAANAVDTYPSVGGGILHFMPDEVRHWDTDLPEDARVSFTTYLTFLIRHLTVEADEVSSDTFSFLGPVIASLRAAAKTDASSSVRSSALLLLGAVLPMRTLAPFTTHAAGHDGDFSIDDLSAWVAEELAAAQAKGGPENLVPVWVGEQVREIKQWWSDRQAAGP